MIDSKYLEFKEIVIAKRKTKTCSVISKSSREELGRIAWYGPWRQYCFFPDGDTVWNLECLKDIRRVIQKLIIERKEKH